MPVKPTLMLPAAPVYAALPEGAYFSGAGMEEDVLVGRVRDLRQLRGSYDEITDRRGYEGTALDDYVQITLTDEEDVPDAMAKLRLIYPNLMLLRYDNARTREQRVMTGNAEVERRTPLELFEEFYELQNNQPMSAEQHTLVQELIAGIWEQGGKDR